MQDLPKDMYTVVNEAEYDWLGEQVAPFISVQTGINDGSFAAQLDIYYRKNAAGNITHTYCVTVGEYMNAEPCAYPRYVSPEQVLADYMLETRDV